LSVAYRTNGTDRAGVGKVSSPTDAWKTYVTQNV
jgi:hypothetical protein